MEECVFYENSSCYTTTAFSWRFGVTFVFIDQCSCFLILVVLVSIYDNFHACKLYQCMYWIIGYRDLFSI